MDDITIGKDKIMKKGFTLVELMVVVVIIGILTGIALPQYTKSVRRAEMTEGLTHGRTIYDAAVRYKGINSDVPTDLSALDVSFIEGTSENPSEFDDGTFSYILETDYVTASNNHGDYEIRFYYPVYNNSGVYAPVGCCPKGEATEMPWVCSNAGQDLSEGLTTVIPSLEYCREIK